MNKSVNSGQQLAIARPRQLRSADAVIDSVEEPTGGASADFKKARRRKATLADPTNVRDGATYILIVTQDATGSRTLAYGPAFKWPGGGTAPALSTAAGAVDILTFVADGGNLYGVAVKNFA